MRRTPLVLLLAGAVVFLVSLFLPWQAVTRPPVQTYFKSPGGAQMGLENLFRASAPGIDAWSSSGAAPAAALAALVLGGLAVGALLRSDLGARLPVGRLALLTGYFGLAVWIQARSYERQLAFVGGGPAFHTGYGAYLAAGAVVVALLAAAADRVRPLPRHRFDRAQLVVLPAAICLLVTLLLPWEQARAVPHTALTGLDNPAAIIAAALAVWLLGGWDRPRPSAGPERLLLAGAAAVFTLAAFDSLTGSVQDSVVAARGDGAWLAVGAAGTLVAVAVVSQLRSRVRPERPSWTALATCAAASAVIASPFLAWTTACYPATSLSGEDAERCVSTNALGSTSLTAAAALGFGLAAAALLGRRLPLPAIVPASAISLLVASLVITIEGDSRGGIASGLAAGTLLGLAGAAVLLGLAVLPAARRRSPALDWRSVALRLPALAACVAYLVPVVIPRWNVFPSHLETELQVLPLSWPGITALLLALWLFCLWTQQIARPAAEDAGLVLLPLAMLALALPNLVADRASQPTWGGGVLVAVCLLLVLLGAVERSDGLESFQVPELLRIDRL